MSTAPIRDLSFQPLVDEDRGEGQELPVELAAVVRARWALPPATDRPYVYANFVTSRDGRISFVVPGHAGGGDVSRGCVYDRWLMGLIRSRADAVLVGDGTVRTEPEHLWTSQYVWPEDVSAFDALRKAEGRASVPTIVVLSLLGDLPAEAAILRSEGPVVVLTTEAGVRQARQATRDAVAPVEILAFGGELGVDLSAALRELRSRGVASLLCEGGPRAYGSMLAAGLIDDEFLTLSPVVVGENPGQPRPSLVEGVGFTPQDPPVSRLVSLLRAGDYLFLRSTYRVADG